MKTFMALVEGISNKLEREELTPEQQRAEAVGEMFAYEFLLEARAGRLPADALVLAISTLSNPDIYVLAGFLREISKALEGK